MNQQINVTIVLFHCVTDSQCFVSHFTIDPLKTKPVERNIHSFKNVLEDRLSAWRGFTEGLHR